MAKGAIVIKQLLLEIRECELILIFPAQTSNFQLVSLRGADKQRMQFLLDVHIAAITYISSMA